MSNTEKQAAFNGRQRALGLVKFQQWLTPEDARMHRLVIAGVAQIVPIENHVISRQTPGANQKWQSILTAPHAELTQLQAEIDRLRKDLADSMSAVDLFIESRQRNKPLAIGIFRNICESQLRMTLRLNAKPE